MSEFEPGFNKPAKDERDELLHKQAEYEKALFDVQQKEAFGKFDVTVPNEGEDTYQSYIDKRPGEGIVRNAADQPVNTETNKFASQEAYEAQKGNSQDYYDKLGGIAAKQEQFTPPTYEEMGLLQLAKEASKARQLGDPAEEATIRAALEHHLTGDALKDDTETPEQAQARYDADLARYEELVDKLSKRGETWPPHAADAHAEPNGEGNPSARTETSSNDIEESPSAEAGSINAAIEAGETTDAPEADSSEDEVADTESAAVEADASETEAADVAEEAPEGEEPAATETTEEEKPAAPKGASYNGKSVRVASVIPHPSGDASLDSLTVVDEDGNVVTVHASEIVYSGVAAPVEEKVPGTEVELYRPEGHEVVAVAQEVETQEKGIKKWWGKVRDSIYKVSGAALWAKEWAQGKHAQWVEHGVTDEMSPEEQEKKRNTNRKIVIAAGVGLAAIGLGSVIALGVTHALNEAAPDANIASGGGTSGGQELGGTGQDVLNGNNGGDRAENFVLPIDGNPGVEEVVDAAPNPSDYTIFDGDGGEGVFQRLGIDPAKWYDVAPTLLAEAPGDFYQEGADIRFAHTGQLSQRAQEIINSLR